MADFKAQWLQSPLNLGVAGALRGHWDGSLRGPQPTNRWQKPTRLDIHASSKQAAKGRLLMMAALIVISVFALAGACFPSTPPCISNLRQRTRH